MQSKSIIRVVSLLLSICVFNLVFLFYFGPLEFGEELTGLDVDLISKLLFPFAGVVFGFLVALFGFSRRFNFLAVLFESFLVGALSYIKYARLDIFVFSKFILFFIFFAATAFIVAEFSLKLLRRTLIKL